MDKAESSREVSQWATLNRDILVVIFGKLGVRDVINGASRVCVSWFLVCQCKTLWNTVDFTKLQQEEEGLSLRNILTKIINFFDIGEPRRSLRRVTEFSGSVPKNLYFDCDSYIEDEDLMFAALSQWKNLKTLIIANEFEFKVVGENCTNLTNLKYLGYLEKKIAEQIVRYLKNLKRSSLRSSPVNYAGVLLLITGLKNLLILNLSHCKELVPNSERVTFDDLEEAATEKKLDKFIFCSKDYCKVCEYWQIFCLFWNYSSKYWRYDDIKELKF